MSSEANMNQTPLKSQLWRVFCAVELPQGVRERAAAHIARLRETEPDVSANWDREEKLHITLKFFGEIEASRIADLSNATTRATQSQPPMTIGLEGAGAFHSRGTPRVLWLGVKDEAEKLAHLHQSLEDECEAAGFAREKRAFHPHLTIARVRSPEGAKGLAIAHREMGFELMEFPLTELVLMRSELGTEGSSYTVISRHSLKDDLTAS